MTPRNWFGWSVVIGLLALIITGDWGWFTGAIVFGICAVHGENQLRLRHAA